MPKRARGSGSIYQQKGSATWWVKYYRNGTPHRESCHSTKKQVAIDLLKTRIGEIASGTFFGPKAERILIEDLADDFLRDYRVNDRKSIDDVTARWELHLKPFFASLRAVQVSSDLIARYVDQRQQEGAKNATINRELAALKRMFRLGYRATPPKVNRVPAFTMLREDNARKGFLSDEQYQSLIENSPGLWFRAMVEVGRTYGWRIGELKGMRVKQVDAINHTIRLEPGTTKNKEGREVTMTKAVYDLLNQCVHGKSEDAFVFTRDDGTSISDFRKAWANACCAAGLGKLLCPTCNVPASPHVECPTCERKYARNELRYEGLIFHDLRRTAARNLRRAGAAEGVIMKIGGWRTRSVFERYAIVSQTDILDALQKLESREIGHSFGHSKQVQENPTEQAIRPN